MWIGVAESRGSMLAFHSLISCAILRASALQLASTLIVLLHLLLANCRSSNLRSSSSWKKRRLSGLPDCLPLYEKTVAVFQCPCRLCELALRAGSFEQAQQCPRILSPIPMQPGTVNLAKTGVFSISGNLHGVKRHVQRYRPGSRSSSMLR